MEKIVQGSKEWMNYIQGGEATDGQCMFSSQSYYDSFWEDAAHGIAIISETGEVIDANPAFCQLLDIPYNETCGLHIRDFVADGAWREDMRTIDTIAIGRLGGTTTEERWKFHLNNNGPFIPVRIRAVRIPTNRAQAFKHIILHVYDLRSTRYDAQGTNWSNKQWSEIWKEVFMNHFGKIAIVLITLLVLLGLNGTLGDTIDKAIKSYSDSKRPVYIENHQGSPVSPTPNPNTCEHIHSAEVKQ